MHETDAIAIGGGAAVKVYSLNERTGTVAHSDNGDSYLSHLRTEAMLPTAWRCGQDAKLITLIEIWLPTLILACSGGGSRLSVESDAVIAMMQAINPKGF
jgi:hypothetical protein